MFNINPVTEPIAVLFIVSSIILFVPVVFKLIRIPSLIGLIIIGAVIGPNGFNVLLRNTAIIHFGTVGLLYIMFISGIEIDLSDFKKNKYKSIIFGILTFSIPQIFGTLITVYFLGYSMKASILLASMYASHTLITYPIISRLKLSRNTAVNITVGGTIITNILSLLVLSIISASSAGELALSYWVKMSIMSSLFIVIVFLVLPGICRWFFHRIENQGGSQFIFVLSIIFAVSLLAKYSGIEPIIGAFIAGILLNELILPGTPLLDKLTFTGNTIFIPYFLISVGMLIDVKIFFSEPKTWIVGITMILSALILKLIPAMITGKIFSFKREEAFIIFGLSNSQAASTLAAVMVGYNLGILDELILNGTILMIMVTILVSTLVTEKFGKKLVSDTGSGASTDSADNILVSLSNPANAEKLIQSAIAISTKNSVINALSIVNDDNDASKNILSNELFHNYLQEKNVTYNRKIESVIRVDINIVGGIIRAAKELKAATLITGFNKRETVADKFFGTMREKILEQFDGKIIMCNFKINLEDIEHISFYVTDRNESDYKFNELFFKLFNIAVYRKCSVDLYCSDKFFRNVPSLSSGIELNHIPLNSSAVISDLKPEITEKELLVIFSTRKDSINWTKSSKIIEYYLRKKLSDRNFILAYPEIDPETKTSDMVLLE